MQSLSILIFLRSRFQVSVRTSGRKKTPCCFCWGHPWIPKAAGFCLHGNTATSRTAGEWLEHATWGPDRYIDTWSKEEIEGLAKKSLRLHWLPWIQACFLWCFMLPFQDMRPGWCTKNLGIQCSTWHFPIVLGREARHGFPPKVRNWCGWWVFRIEFLQECYTGSFVTQNCGKLAMVQWYGFKATKISHQTKTCFLFHPRRRWISQKDEHCRADRRRSKIDEWWFDSEFWRTYRRVDGYSLI